jgi:hypothetical protein
MNKIIQHNYKSMIRPVVPKKRALLVGINYKNTRNELYGCINDVLNISKLLIPRGYSCTILTDQTAVKATKKNILDSFRQMLINSVPGDICFFHYSGHGISTIDRNGDELDRRDEMICPCDMNYISDDEMNLIIRNFLQAGVTLFGLFDSCYSGTMLDLKYNYLNNVINPKVPDTKTNVIMISGCMDTQTSADTFIDKSWVGAMTTSFLKSLPNSTSLSSLLRNMRIYLSTNRYSQIPQLSTGRLLNINLTNLYF